MTTSVHQPPPSVNKTTRLIVLWSRPAEQESFEQRYAEEHMPLASRLPGLIRATSARIASRGYHRMAELTFASNDDLKAALASPAGEALAADAKALEERFAVTSTSMIAVAADIVDEPGFDDPIFERPSLDTDPTQTTAVAPLTRDADVAPDYNAAQSAEQRSDHDAI